MNKSVLGPHLEAERQKTFIGKIGQLIAQKETLGAKDRIKLEELAEKIEADRGTFSPSIEQLSWITELVGRLSSNPVSENEIKKLIPEARVIISNGGLPSGRLMILVGIVDAYDENGTLSRKDLNTLHFLVLEGKGYRED